MQATCTRVQLEVDLSSAIDERLMEGQLDLALQTGPFKSKVFASEPLGQEPYCWVGHPDIVQNIGAKPSLMELFDLTVLTHAKHTQACAALHQMAAAHGLRRERIVHSSALSACVLMVLEGLGVAFLPERLVQDEILAGHLHKIHADWLPDSLSFFARYAPTRTALYVEKAAGIAKLAMQYK
mgnify:CR=1 FL=1